MSNFIFNHFGWVITALVVAILTGILHLGKIDAAKRERFIAQCTQDHKEYECVAMWRAGESHTQVVPVVIPTR